MPLFQTPVTIQTNTYQVDRVRIYYPSVVGLANRYIEQAINQRIYQQVIALQEEQMNYQTGMNMEMIGQFEIKTNERGILSLTLSNYAYSEHMAHGMTLVKALTFNLATGQEYSLADLFQPGSDYVGLLSEQITQQIEERDIPLLNGFSKIRADQDYYLADKSIVVFFQLYEITPYYVGLPMFPISIYTLLSIVPEHSPLSVLAASIA